MRPILGRELSLSRDRGSKGLDGLRNTAKNESPSVRITTPSKREIAFLKTAEWTS